MSAKYKSPSFLLPNEKNTSLNPSLSADRASNYSMDFDGTEYIDTNFVPADNLTLDFSVSAWVNMPALSNNNDATILGTYQFTNGRSRFFFRIYLTGGVYKYFFGLGPNTNYIQDSSVAISNFSVNTWVHLAFTYDGTNVKLYSNGTLDGTLSWSGTNNTYPPVGSGFNGNSYIGASNRTGGSGLESEFTGKIDEVAIFNKALTDGTGGTVNQIASLYNSGSPTSAATTINLGAIAYYPLGEQAQNTGYLGNEITNGWQFPNGVLQDYVMNFDGSDDFVQTSGFTIGNNYSFSCWLKSDTISPSTSVFLSSPNYYGAGYNGNFIIRFTNSTTIQMYSFDGTANQELSAATIPAIDTNWHHFFLTSNGTTTKIYWDGSPLTVTGNQTKSLDNLLQGLIIGYEVNFGNNPFSGQISNVAVWNSDQSSNIANIYNNGSPQTSYTVTPQNWWKLNADSVYTPSAPNYTTALDFNSTKADIDYVQFGNTSLSLPASLSIWLKPLGVPPSGYGMPYSDSSGEIYWTPSSNNMRYEITLAGAPQLNSTLIAPADVGGWHHLVVTFTSTATKLYLDGQLNASGSGGTGTNFGQDINIGRWKQYGTNILYGFVGSISNFAIFNSELSASQVSTLFNFGTPETNISLSPIHNWKLDNLTTGLNDTGSLASNNGTAGSVNGTGPVQELTSVAVVPSWKIPDASGTSNGVSTTLPSTALQQSDLQFDSPYSNYSLSFDGNSYIDTNLTLPASYTSYSYSFWFKRTTSANPGSAEYIISNLVAPGYNYQARGLIRFGGTNLRIQGGDGTGPGDYDTGNISATAILDQNWHHISVTFVSGEIKTYFDGSLVNTYTNAAIVTGYAAARTYVIGQSGIGSGYLVNSLLDEFAIFDKKLTEAEILSIYNNGKPNDISTLSPTNWWRLGENAYFNTGTTPGPEFTVPNSITGAPNGIGSGTVNSIISADAPGTYANGIGTNLDIVDRVGDAALSTANSQSYNMIPDDKVPYVPGYVGLQTNNNFSMTFDGNNKINSGTANAYNIVTLSAWVKPNNPPNYAGIFGTRNLSGLVLPYHLGVVSNKFRFIVTDSTGLKEITANTSFSNNVWYHVVGVADGSTTKLYIDGVLQTATGSYNGTISAPDDDLMIGAQTSVDTSYEWVGSIDEVAIWDTALSADQIKFDLYNATTTGKTADIANNTNLPTPVAWYRMGD